MLVEATQGYCTVARKFVHERQSHYACSLIFHATPCIVTTTHTRGAHHAPYVGAAVVT